MTVLELYKKLEEMIPAELSCDWDNDGIMCLPDKDKEVNKVLLSLDATPDAVEYAVKNGFDVIVTHHPMIFRPIKSVRDERLITLIKGDTAVFSFHTRLDIVDGGVNTALAMLLGLRDCERFGEDGLGVIGSVDKTTDRQFAIAAKKLLNADKIEAVLFDREIQRVAVLGGDGEHYIHGAANAGADLYLSGRLSYNDMLDASSIGMSMVAAGHYHTENPVLKMLGKMITDIDSDIVTAEFSCNLIESL